MFYVLYQYCRAAKSIIQIYLTMNRMTCVTFPAQHASFWKHGIVVAYISTITVPLAIVWNPLLSRMYPMTENGGLAVAFANPLGWPFMATSQLVLVIIALLSTTICTLITFYRMISLPTRVKSAERLLCIASFVIYAGFFVVGLNQTALAMCHISNCSLYNFFLVTLSFCFDFLNICSPLTMIIASSLLRNHISTIIVPISSILDSI